jgi:hypothetical protein
MSGCVGKERFTTYAFAERVASLSASRNEGVRRQAYKCGECGAFHVGSSVAEAAVEEAARAHVDA